MRRRIMTVEDVRNARVGDRVRYAFEPGHGLGRIVEIDEQRREESLDGEYRALCFRILYDSGYENNYAPCELRIV